MVMSPSRSILNFSFILRRAASRSGAYPSVTLYWSACVDEFSKISAEMRASSFTGNDRGEGFPAAKLIISGSVRLLNISRIAEGFRSLILSEKRYSIILSYPFADYSPYILPYTQGLFNDFCQSFAARRRFRAGRLFIYKKRLRRRPKMRKPIRRVLRCRR